MASSLFVLIDDIATILDDVAVLSKVAAKKTAGVLGDDLALNAQQVVGVKADRELPVVWAVAKGSFINKLILVPAALLISAFAPVLVTLLLLVGGAFLCFEGFEKIAHRFLHTPEEDTQHHADLVAAVANSSVDLVNLEREKIKGAIRTDFILSAEIVVITLGIVAGETLLKQLSVLTVLSVAMTVGVYGLVAGIVRMDDMGLNLHRQASAGKRAFGRFLLLAAPALMKFLSLAGTLAMFLVGGGIVSHEWPWLHHLIEAIVSTLAAGAEGWLPSLVKMVLEGISGLILGAAVLVVVSLASRVAKLFAKRGVASAP
jgi:predicted DNA repair protein MutK